MYNNAQRGLLGLATPSQMALRSNMLDADTSDDNYSDRPSDNEDPGSTRGNTFNTIVRVESSFECPCRYIIEHIELSNCQLPRLTSFVTMALTQH